MARPPRRTAAGLLCPHQAPDTLGGMNRLHEAPTPGGPRERVTAGDPSRRVKSAVLLLGSFAVGYNVAHAIHELGHAAAVWMCGGSVTGLSLHPFSWSTIRYSVPTTLGIAAAGPGFAAMIGLLGLAIVRRWRSPWAVPFLVTSICTLVVNAAYLLVDGVLRAGGDATDLRTLGLPLPILAAAGGILLGLGAVAALSLLPRLGLDADDGFGRRFFVLGAGIGSYLLAMFLYHAIFNAKEIALWSAFAGTGMALIAAWATFSRAVESRWGRDSVPPSGGWGWGAPLGTMALGAAAVIGELAMYTGR